MDSFVLDWIATFDFETSYLLYLYHSSLELRNYNVYSCNLDKNADCYGEAVSRRLGGSAGPLVVAACPSS